MLTLPRGANAEVPAHLLLPGALTRCLVRWRSAPGLDLDLSAVLLRADGRVASDADFVFFNNLRHPSGAINARGRRQQSPHEFDCIDVNLGLVPDDVNTVVLAAFGTFERLSALPEFHATVEDHNGQSVVLLDLRGTGDEAAIMLAEFYRRAGGWKIRCLGQGWSSGMPGLLQHVGIETTEEPAPPLAPTGIPGPSERPPLHQFNAPPVAPPTPTPPPRPLPPPGRSLFGVRKADLQRENETLTAELARLGAMESLELRREVAFEREQLAALRAEATRARRELQELQAQIVTVDDTVGMQAAGIYDFEHPLDTSVQYKSRLDALRQRCKALVKANAAVLAATNWTVNGSTTQGAAMVRDMSKLLLRAYNAEADHCARVVRARTLEANTRRLERAAESIRRLGKTMSIQVSPAYAALRVEELRLVSDYHARLEQEKEEAREQRARLRDEQRAQAEFERETAKLEVERDKNEEALRRARAGTSDAAVIAQLEARLAAIEETIHDVERRAANVRMGTVYVISNRGAFGPNMVKIGMTRRVNPDDRVRELGDASVPFRFDTHALIFSDDAVALEGRLHAAFADRRVNMINARREFFYVNPSEVRNKLAEYANEHLIEFTVEADAEEWRRSGARTDGWNGIGGPLAPR